MFIKLIKGTYFVWSRKGVIYKVTKDLVCECKGYNRWGHCKHQKAVEEFCTSQEVVDDCRVYGKTEREMGDLRSANSSRRSHSRGWPYD